MSVAAPPSVCREAFAVLAPLFAFPGEDYLREVAGALPDVARADQRAGSSLNDFARGIARLGRAQREITYTSTFDLAPACSPYVGVHLFGEDGNHDRGRLMVGLRRSYLAAGNDRSGELPDHLAVVLGFTSQFTDDEWADLVRLVLVPATERMESTLSDTTNPYRHLVSTARHLSRAALEEGERE